MYNKGLKTALPPGEVIPFWTLVDSNKMVLIAGEGEKGSSLPFNYKKTDNIVLQFDNSNEVMLLRSGEREGGWGERGDRGTWRRGRDRGKIGHGGRGEGSRKDRGTWRREGG